ncbi:TonB-dependent receptor [Sphingomonas sp.]|uniref:TonB-dependent receptor n=1 Tax=Sphingomonas sp. TaxID=28214 RepID=UPI003B00374E
MTKGNLVGLLLSGAAMTTVTPAVAQVAAGGTPDAAVPTQPPSAQTDAAPADQLTLGDIVVTAQKREQSLQRVPISINAFDSAAIEALSAETIGDLDTFTPGLTINDSSVTQPNYAIRGVQTDDFGIGTEPSVGIFIDGVYSGRSGASLIFFNDIARVEVLKGPQGTLFGRNTSAGAISIITNQPVAEPMMRGTVQYGNYDKVRLDVTGNSPITDNLFLRINGVVNRRSGYLRDALTGERREREDNTSGRAALRWEPTSAIYLTLAYDHDDTAKDGPTAVGISRNALSLSPFGPFSNDVIDNKETRLLNDVTFTANARMGAVTLTSISSFKHFETHNREDEDGTADPTRYLDTENIERNSSIYQEFRAGYASDFVTGIVGASYFHERGRQTSAVTLLSDSVDRLIGGLYSALAATGVSGLFGQQYREDMNNRAANESYALFGDATFRLTDQLSLIGGIRYTHDDKRFTWLNGGFDGGGLETTGANGAVYNAILGGPVLPPGTFFSAADFLRAITGGPQGLIFDVGALEGVRFTRRERFNDVSPRFVVQYQYDPNLLLFASATRGYKAGGFNSVQINSFFSPENVWNYEGGMKSELFGRRVRLNASGYYFTYKNRQSISLEDTGGQLPQYITRSGDSRAYGVDLEARVLVARDLTLSAVASAIDSQWKTRLERGIDISGQTTGEPRFRSVVSAHYDHRMGSGGSVFGDTSWSYTSRVPLNDANRDSNAAIAPFVDFSQLRKLYSARSNVNARVGWRLPGDNFTISVFGENILDDQRPRTLNTISADIFNTPYVRLDRPAFYGVELGFRF